MRYFFTFVGLLLLTSACRKQEEVSPVHAAVTSLADLPTTYQPFQGNSIAGRLKRQTQGGKTSGEWRYNERGQLIEWRRFRFDAVESADQYRYDVNGRLRYVQKFSNNCMYSSLFNCTGPVEWTSYDELETDASGRVMESRTYLKLDGKWDFRSRSTYEYNTQSQIAKLFLYDAKGALTLTKTFTHDARGNVIAIREQSSTAPADLADRTFSYEYDTGRNPYFNTVYYTAALFLSPNTQLEPDLTYEYRPDGLPIRMRQNGSVWELEYY